MDERLKGQADGGGGGDSYRREREPSAERIPAVQWVVASLGAGVTLATVGYLVFLSVAGAKTPSDIRVNVDSVYWNGSGWAAAFTARNLGDQTAQQVLVRARAGSADVGETTLDFLPGHGRRSGGIHLDERSPEAGLRLTAESWTIP